MNTVTSHPTETAKPYKGPESYQIHDAELFFGREDETDQVIARILANRFTLLHAQSGAGKTSLLNARIIPGLESHGWNAFRILPHNDPIESIRAATLNYLLPSPTVERLAIERASRSLGDGQDITLKTLLGMYDSLEVRNARRRDLITPIESPAGADRPVLDLSVGDPYFCKLLRSSIDIEVLGEHIAAVEQAAHTSSKPQSYISGDTRLSELVAIFTDQKYQACYNRLVNELKVPGRDLRVFFEHLVETYGRRRSRFGVVLVLDQFEELFTRFIDPGVTAPKNLGDLPDWKLRWELFDQLQSLYGTEPTLINDESDGNPTLPIRYVVSMRDEYIAQMDPVRRFVTKLEESSYHLSLLEKEQATLAIKEPVRFFGYTYQQECFDRIIEQLTKEDRFVEPAHLQLVCDKLWTEKGRELASIAETDKGAVLLIREDVFRNLGETPGILESFFTDFLDDLDEQSRRETLEILEPLVTQSGTRNIIERNVLVDVPFRDSQKRRALLDSLVNHTIVRTERRLGGYFVEITHEFLITPILDAIANGLYRDQEYNRYRSAMRTLERCHGWSLAGVSPPLSQQEFFSLHAQREIVKWDAWSVELMFRCAIAYAASSDVLTLWSDEFRNSVREIVPTSVYSLIDKALNKGERSLLTLAELRCINANKESTANLIPEQIEFVWRSELFWATEAERNEVEHWTRRMKGDHG